MKIKILIGLAFCFFAFPVNAQEIEEVIVVGSTVEEFSTDHVDDDSLLEVITPMAEFTQGGFGGYVGYTDRGTQSKHTSVYRNGVPVNDAGAGWYDFAHDITTGNESVKIVSGANSVLYGSASMAGTIFINDNFDQKAFASYGDNYEKFYAGYKNVSISRFDVSNGSVKTDNNEIDSYVNTTARAKAKLLSFDVVANYTDYDYDYDGCYNASWAKTDDCQQKGDKGGLSIRNDFLTIGYNYNNATYFTEDVETSKGEAERYFVDARQAVIETKEVSTIVGASFTQEVYNNNDREEYSIYSVLNYKDLFDIGVRASEDYVVGRLGVAYELFFANAGTSFRSPTLNEINGDAWTLPNPDLEPEEAFGFEIGYGSVSYFNYEFSEGIDYVYSVGQYVNTGEYDTQGLRFNDSFSVPWGGLGVDIRYTDTDQFRVPRWSGNLNYFASVNGWNINTSWSFVNDRKPSPYDGDTLEDYDTFNISLSRLIGNDITISGSIRDLFDNNFEIVPGYRAGGRTFVLTLTWQ